MMALQQIREYVALCILLNRRVMRQHRWQYCKACSPKASPAGGTVV
jgi:hypothetical protein